MFPDFFSIAFFVCESHHVCLQEVADKEKKRIRKGNRRTQTGRHIAEPLKMRNQVDACKN